jgi:MFS family permease
MLGKRALAHIFAIVTVASISGSLLFNFTTNGNGELLRERFRGIVDDPAALGALLALAYVAGALTQVAVGLLLDRVSLKKLYAAIVAAQAPLFLLAANAEGWALYALMIAFMVAVFGAIPFTDAMIVRYVDDRMRSRVSGMRLAVAFGVSSLAVWLLGPLVKAAGFRTLLLLMAAIAAVTLVVVLLLPRTTGRGLSGSPEDIAREAAD